MKAMSFRLDEKTIDLLERIADEGGFSKTEIVRRAIRQYAEGGTNAVRDDALVAVLKDEVKALREQLTQAQAVNVEQSRALQAQAVSLLGAPGRRHWWQFWRQDD